jgi:hypothetical protein
MRGLTFAVLAAAVGFGLTATAPKAQAQVGFGVEVGPAPVCPYGFYDAPPYTCAPYGYYGPEWFDGGLFIGAGPWYHGRDGFWGHVDNRYSRDHGYRGRFPDRGERADRDVGRNRNFRGNEMRDGHGHSRRR